MQQLGVAAMSSSCWVGHDVPGAAAGTGMQYHLFNSCWDSSRMVQGTGGDEHGAGKGMEGCMEACMDRVMQGPF